MPPPLRFTPAEAEAAADDWGFNCGPGALCAVLGLTPNEIRPHLGDFEHKRYTNPTLMWSILRGLGVKWRKRRDTLWPAYGLARIQWAGPWTKPGVPIRARYRHTHWVAACMPDRDITDRFSHVVGVWDINALKWTDLASWATVLVPWLLKECEPKASGEWWLTHSVEVERPTLENLAAAAHRVGVLP